MKVAAYVLYLHEQLLVLLPFIIVMRKRLIALIAGLIPAIGIAGPVYRLEGKIGGTYPVVIELEEFDDGLYSGQYAYKSTLSKSGDVVCSWLMLNPGYRDPANTLSARDCSIEPVESWDNVVFGGGRQLTADMTNVRGKSYDVKATVVKHGDTSKSLLPYYKEHIGEMVYDMDMFNELSIKFRLINLLGWETYFRLKEIYQTQGEYEYHYSMFWGSGFMAHECCDPAAVWAYDTNNNSFYIWMRENGSDRWWSESGNIPYKFQELVNNIF